MYNDLKCDFKSQFLPTVIAKIILKTLAMRKLGQHTNDFDLTCSTSGTVPPALSRTTVHHLIFLLTVPLCHPPPVCCLCSVQG